MKPPVISFFASGLLFTASLLPLLPGCKPKAPENEPPAPPSVRANGTESSLASGPVWRAVVISEPAGNRRDWALQALQNGYRASGHTHANWDSKVTAAFEAFADYTRIASTNFPALERALDDLAQTGCNDPMIQYVQVRYHSHGDSPKEDALAFIRAHDAMLGSKHHPLFRFMAGLRAVDHARTASKNSDRSQRITWTTLDLKDAVSDTNAPVEEIFQAVNLWVKHSSTKGWNEYVLKHVGPLLEQHWAQNDAWPTMQGRLEIEQAWANRGGDYAYKVTDEGWKGFEEHLVRAGEYLLDAWSKNPSNAETAYLMMKVELGQGRGLPQMEKWFHRAMKLNTNYYDAAKLMSFYLEPRWYGSDAQAIHFGRACVGSDEWGGSVPLVLANLHRSLAKYHHGTNTQSYWIQPHVWQDMKSSWDRFFELNPEAVGWHHDYAKDAYTCGQYAAFLNQVELFAGGTNYAFFGGEETFNAMLQTARAATSAPKQ